jgi:ubiquinone/menaquinone biosynthesis C-methylase UbiE
MDGFKESAPITEERPTIADQRADAWSTCTEYDVFAEAVTRPFAEDAVRLVKICPGCRTLDVAAGTGSFALAAARRGAHVLATDFAPAMLRKLEQKSDAEGLHNVRTEVMDGQALELEDASFDVAGSLFGLMFFPNYDQGLRELLRVLKPGGQAVIGVWAAPGRVELMRLLGEAAMAAMIDVPLSSGEPQWAPLSSASHLPERLRKLGFARAHVVVVRHMWAFEHAEYLAELLPTMTPAYAELVQLMTATQRQLFSAALADGLRDRQGDGPYALTTEGLIAVGTKAR